MGAAPTSQPGGLGRVLTRWLMKRAQVVASDAVAEDFRLITLQSPAFKGLDWLPGQKIQIAMGSAFVARTFTPIDWDSAAGRTRLLAYTHGEGPGSAWARNTKPGDPCDIFGPRASLDGHRASGRCVLLGDETSIGLAYALSKHMPDCLMHSLLEVNTRAGMPELQTRLTLDNVEWFKRAAGGAHLADIEARLQATVGPDVTFVLTGKAASIQHLRRVLKTMGVPGARMMSKAYWAEGKTGLD